MTANDDKRMQLINSIEAYAYGTNKEIIHKKEEITCIGITKHYSTIKNVYDDDVTKENINEHKPN